MYAAISVFLFLALSFSVCASENEARTIDSLVIVQVSDDRPVQVNRSGHSGMARVGSALSLGDILITEPKQDVKIESRDGANLVIGGGSSFEVGEEDHTDHLVYLHNGKLIGVFHSKGINPPKRKFRFMVKTSTAVMGVRGTEFVVESDEKSKSSSFRVIEGVVDISNSLTHLLADNFVVVKSGEFVSAAYQGVDTAADVAKGATFGITHWVESGVRGISSVLPFDPVGFVAGVNSSLPDRFHIPLLTGETPKYPEDEAWYHLSSFEIYSQKFLWSNQIPDPQNGFVFGISWNPTFEIAGQQTSLRGHFGFINNGIEIKTLVTYIPGRSLFLEGGPAIQVIRGYGSAIGLSVNSGIEFRDTRIFHLIDRFVIGLSEMDTPFAVSQGAARSFAWEIRFGLGFRIF